MVGAKAGVATLINEMESYAKLTHCHGHALQLAVGGTIKAIKIMRSTLDAAFEFNKLKSNTLLFKNHRTEIKYSLKRERAFSRLREDTKPGNSGNRTLCSNRWVIWGTLLQSILDNWAVFQGLWDGILEGKVDSEIRGQVKGVQTQMQSFNFFFGM